MAEKGSFADHGVDQEMPTEQSAAALEHQQAVLLQVLRRRRGMGVSFAELQEAGIEFPASVVSELELAGVPIERCVLRAQGPSTVGVRLDPTWPGSPAPRQGRSIAERTIVQPTTPERPLTGGRHSAHDRPRVAFARYRTAHHLATVWVSAAGVWVAATAGWAVAAAVRAVAILKTLTAAAMRLSNGRLRNGRLSNSRLRELRAKIAASVKSLRDESLRNRPLHEMRVVLAAAQSHSKKAITPVQWMSKNEWMSKNAHHKRLLAPAALLAVMGITIALVVGHLGTGRDHAPQVRAHTHQHAYTAGSTTDDSTHTGTTGNAARTPPPTQAPVSPKLAAELQLRGHELLDAGEYTEAAHLLNKALAASGKNVQNCLQPVSGACRTYAYALYDLGRALMLGGIPAAAVPVLERRLQIENQRPVVTVALEQARAQMG